MERLKAATPGDGDVVTNLTRLYFRIGVGCYAVCIAAPGPNMKSKPMRTRCSKHPAVQCARVADGSSCSVSHWSNDKTIVRLADSALE